QALDSVLEGEYITPAPGDDDAAHPAIAYDPSPLFQQIADAANLDALDLVGDSLRDVPDEHYDALQRAYQNRRAELTPAD
ncbi:recombinase RecT, partial [Bordetella avium]